MKNSRLIASTCAFKERSLDDVVTTFARLGFEAMECFSRWTKAALDETQPPAALRARVERGGMKLYSLHLPPLTADLEASLLQAQKAACFAAALGMKLVVLPADDRALYRAAAPRFLDLAQELGFTTVVEIHANASVANLEDVADLFRLVPDPRLKVVLEVGHLHKACQHWRDATALLGERLGIVHLKDIRDGQNVGWRRGEIDLDGMMAHLRERKYTGDFVVEILVPDAGNTEQYLREAREWFLAKPD